ncbi:hypothetical protein [Pseudomonas sp. RL_105y_Pfl2_101]|uniref:hypothetical protein n=1 Tax=Pseudomonas sp. RL_105y_Pfl2_101 TaxID=3088708 RepID=UPI0030DBA737
MSESEEGDGTSERSGVPRKRSPILIDLKKLSIPSVIDKNDKVEFRLPLHLYTGAKERDVLIGSGRQQTHLRKHLSQRNRLVKQKLCRVSWGVIDTESNNARLGPFFGTGKLENCRNRFGGAVYDLTK